MGGNSLLSVKETDQTILANLLQRGGGPPLGMEGPPSQPTQAARCSLMSGTHGGALALLWGDDCRAVQGGPSCIIRTWRPLASLPWRWLLAGATGTSASRATQPPAKNGHPTSTAQRNSSDERNEEISRLDKRVADIERDYAQANEKVVSGDRTATAGLREELKEDVTNVKTAVNDLRTTTPENWWDRHEAAMRRTADDIEADVSRLAGKVTPHRRKLRAARRAKP